MTETKMVSLPVAARRARKRRYWPTLLAMLILTVVGIFIARDYLVRGQRLTVEWSDIFGLRIGAPVETLTGQRAGEVIAVDSDGRHSLVTIELARDDEALADQILREGSAFFIERFSSTNLELQGAGTVINGPRVLVQVGDPAAAPSAHFGGSSEAPPDRRVCWNSARVRVAFPNSFRLARNAPVVHSGEEIGVVERVQLAADGSVEVELACFETDARACPYLREGTRWYIERFHTERLEILGAATALRGSYVTVIPGNPQGKTLARFIGRAEPPPDVRVRFDSVRAEVLAANAQGLRAKAPVREWGANIGEVEEIAPVPDSDRVKVQIVFYENDRRQCRCLRGRTRYFVNMARLTAKGVEGDPTTAIYGAFLEAVSDPLWADDAVRDSFIAEDGPPPRYLPEQGEQALRLESEEWVPPDTPLCSQGEVIGYVLRSERAKDSRSFYCEARVYPSALQQVRANSVFYLQPKLQAKLFRARGPFSWEGPQLQVPNPEALLRPGIELRNPPESGPAAVFNRAAPPSFPLAQQPRDEWLQWRSGAAADAPAPAVALPRPVRAELAWRKPYVPMLSWQKHEGFALTVPGGVIALSELVQLPLPEQKTVKASFKLDGVEQERNPETLSVIVEGELSLLKTDLAGAGLRPDGQLGYAPGPVDLLIATSEQSSHAIDSRRLAADGIYWQISAQAGCDRAWHGAPAVCSTAGSPLCGKVIGMLWCKNGSANAVIIPFPKNISELVK